MHPAGRRHVADFAVNNLFKLILRHGERLLVSNQPGRDCHKRNSSPYSRRVELSLHLPALPSFSCPDRRLLPGAISFEGACRELAFAILWSVRRRNCASPVMRAIWLMAASKSTP